LPRGPLQQAHAQPRFELPDRMRDGRLRIAKVMRRLRETAQLDDAAKQIHCIKSVHTPSIIIACCTV
jgi:hypothetical protein